ncbi:hypothetical protein CPIN18021_0316 [Campylobacter pinnipediorum subsp. caledonicus]|uniref:Uncharacterized protein n=1 Tax=Campylobacter pinnipediorum subsp. caledonicus TaxID=1874362 RepID=A0A1S6U626_9BACT|nr:hypothetical protein [Campylobacter pinnipediorum]AQW84184.1 hypothetical protein CPIN17262_0483 [Campylobacter pinnipediorum subsp. pinnipediorum]AQW85522.1 hypothetical protein CPIN18020_0278 [Campylobacter pinnipediorum subsp. caledonicus]AQW87163.1 hypothetical protein CPIN18021_0316 [Campylobacter pinnipediorum subsp. caledonicus]OPA72036.1 hypothetical protein BB381_00340 [Campylobacter pinnipediorum subsp. caledonicus]
MQSLTNEYLELVLTALALFLSGLNWFISQKLSSFSYRLDKIETSYTDTYQIKADIQLLKEKIDFIIEMCKDNNKKV